MAFIEKNDPTVLSIKLTTKGRELLSKGKLTFDYFAVGDSEIDYNLIKASTVFDPTYSPSILRPADKNPDLISFITNTSGSTEFNAITSVPSYPMIVENTIDSVGFFNIDSGGTVTIKTSTEYVKQPNAKVLLSELIGSNTLKLYKSVNYVVGSPEPSIGDMVMIKMNNHNGDTLNNTVEITNPKPYLFYKIEDVISGTLSGDDLEVTVDRSLPSYINDGVGSYAGVIVFYNSYSGSTIYDSVDYLSDAVLSFYSNAQCDMPAFPYWKMSILYTENIAGAITGTTKYPEFKTSEYAGFVSYIQNQSAIIRKMGVIHYTNSSPSNQYGEGFYRNTPELYIPTIMWHKASGTTLGVNLKAFGASKKLDGLNTAYYDLADDNNNIVGKILNNLKLFVIEDQELLFAMSYKANRSWTLPDYRVGLNSVISNCPSCQASFEVSGNTPTIYGDGTLSVYNIQNVSDSTLLLEVYEGSNRIYFQPILASGITLTNLTGGVYSSYLYDLGVHDCKVTGNTVTIIQPVTTTTTLPPTTTTTTTTLPPATTTLSPATTTVAPTTTLAPTTVAPVSRIHFFNSGGVIEELNSLGQTFTVTLDYVIDASCDNVGTSGADANQATTRMLYSIDNGVNWIERDTVTATVSGGNFPTEQSDVQTSSGSIVITGITNISMIKVDAQIDCVGGLNAKSGSAIVTIVSAIVDFGATSIICSDIWGKNCIDGAYVDCTTTPITTTTLAPTTTAAPRQYWHALSKCIPNGTTYYTGPRPTNDLSDGMRVEGATGVFYVVTSGYLFDPMLGTNISVTRVSGDPFSCPPA